MSPAEMFVSVLCLFVGYWLVSKLLDRGGKGSQGKDAPREPPRQQPRPSEPPSGHGEYIPAEPADARATLSNWYRILGVREEAAAAEIEAAYRRRIALYPDSALAIMSPERRAVAMASVAQLRGAYELGMRRFRG